MKQLSIGLICAIAASAVACQPGSPEHPPADLVLLGGRVVTLEASRPAATAVAVTPPEVTTGHIYRGIVPFVVVQLIGLAIVAFFPQLATWLPKVVFGR